MCPVDVYILLYQGMCKGADGGATQEPGVPC